MGGMTVRRFLLAFCLLLALCIGTASAEGMISASVQVRASRNVYDSVIRVGEDVDMAVEVAGFEPVVCQWYFGEMPLEGENTAALRINSADVADTGVYRMDALDEAGRVRVSVDVALRVVDHTIPKTGDNRIPQNVLLLAMVSAALTLAAMIGCKAAKKRAD